MIMFKTRGSNGRLGVSGDRSSDAGRASQVAALVRDILRRRHAGDRVSDDEVIDANSELMPELGERLKTLGALATAVRSASRAGRPEQSADLRHLNEALPGYTILERVHVGGQGVVYRALQCSTQRVVAIKVLLDDLLASPRQRQRFNHEVEIVSRLRHANIITLFDSGTVCGKQYFVMEFVDGMPIHEHVLMHDMNTREVVTLFIAVCRAVAAAHQNGVIHRDLKPGNILVDLDGQPQVLDFGLAKEIPVAAADSTSSSASDEGRFVGTLPYSSPEQVGGLDGQVDTRSDIYSLGVVLYELLAESFPYPLDDRTQTVSDSTISHQPLPLRRASAKQGNATYRPSLGIDRDLATIVAKALAQEKEQRYQSATELADDLGRFLAGEAIIARSGNSLYVLKKTLQKHRLPAVLITAFVLIFSISITAMWQRAEGIARVAQAKLSMGALLKDGSVRRDDGRTQQAVSLLEGVLEIRDAIQSNDPVVRRYEYGAHHRLAAHYFDAGDADTARPHCEAAVRLAEELVRDDPERLEWKRLLGFSRLLRARLAVSRNDSEAAQSDFDRVVSIREQLLSADPENKSLKAELALAHGWMGEQCMQLSRSTESRTHLETAHELRRELFEAEPDVSDNVIGLAEALINLGSWHISQRLPGADLAALDLLDRAEMLLTDPGNPQHLSSQRIPALRLLSIIEENKERLRERAKRRTSRLDQSGS